MRPGGRICVNIAGTGRKPYLPLHHYIGRQLDNLGFLMRGEIIWMKGASAGVSTAWGSFAHPSNPVLREVHEYILVYSLGDFKLTGKGKSGITHDEFVDWTKSVWTFPTESAKRVGHPAPFPIELPRRLILFYTYEGDTVLDPFCGSGTTCIAAKKLGRNYIGIDTDPLYIDLASSRLANLTDGS